MTADERWSYQLRCPACGRVGASEERELDGWPFRNAAEAGRQFHWVSVSKGFKTIEQTREGYAKVVCADCGVEPERWQVR